ncbi:MAG: Ig-like domain-containing protein [Hymenobacteraceae bacterium]|nr:Ig-like domain-containing protein [Hymenobacteraceae bacterium]MDX5481035.1 Ig-like domain-containing protein [Hymenobacteraceae bacterium]
MRLRTMLASLAAVAMLTACEDLFEDGSLQPDGSKPSLTVNNPSSNQTISASQGLRVNITAVDKDEVKDIDFVVKGVTAEKSLINFKKFPQKKVVEFDTTLVINGIAPGDYTLVVSATDNRTNLSQQEVKFKVK